MKRRFSIKNFIILCNQVLDKIIEIREEKRNANLRIVKNIFGVNK